MGISATATARLKELSGSNADERVVAHLAQLIGAADDLDCYKINAFRVAEQLDVSRPDTVRALLWATRLGVLDLNWDVHCPSCKGVPTYHRHLMELPTRGHCALCEINWDLDFAEQLEVTFTVNPDVRALEVREFCELQFPEHMEWFAQITGREGRMPVVASLLSPGETQRLPGRLEAGEYVMYVPSHLEGGVRLRVRGEPSEIEREVDVEVAADGAVTASVAELQPGPVAFQVRYGYGRLWGFGVHALVPQRNWLSAAYLTSQQDFRDLFAGEFLAPDSSFAVRSLTFLFTDIRGSTEMYEALGDSAAYAVVQEHFRLMSDLIRRREGGVVKTIGDAVMAVFPVNVDGVRAACEVQRALGASDDPLRQVEVKIGLHRGPAIAVTSNRMVDYFGRTVNLAARTQGEAKPREVLLTEAVITDPAVRALLETENLRPTELTAHLRGLPGPLSLYSIRP
ncbi:MAG TPA: DUF5939 domain-containing protein [Kofleriaceae bacterium]|nr:DUF5939 domain-containing protein [Kofleriaceae bacterium]